MFRRLTIRLGCAALAIAATLVVVPSAQAQVWIGGRGFGVGLGTGSWGWGPGVGMGGWGWQSPGAWGSGYYRSPTYYNYPGYAFSTPRYNYGTPSYYGYSTPGYYGTPTSTAWQTSPYGTSGMPTTTQSMYRPTMTTASIMVQLPANAQLWIDDYQSQQFGPVREFVTPHTLEPGKTYHYVLKAQWQENGQTVTRERTVNFQAGSQVNVDFFQPTEPSPPTNPPPSSTTPPSTTPPSNPIPPANPTIPPGEGG